MKKALYLLWALAVLAGVVKIWLWPHRPPAAADEAEASTKTKLCSSAAGEYRARRRLPLNYRIAEGDLERADGKAPEAKETETRYMSREACAGCPVSSRDLADLPLINPRPGHVAFVAALPAGPLASILNAESRVELWREGKRLLEGTRVLAVICTEAPAACSAVVEAPEGRMPELTAGESARIQISLR